MRSGSYPRRELLPPGPSQSARRAITASLPTVLALILLPAIAFASPPDPSWVAGIYDGADGDDVVSLVYETSAAHAAALSHPGPLPCLLGISLEGIAHAVRGRRFTGAPRSPPAVSFDGVRICLQFLASSSIRHGRAGHPPVEQLSSCPSLAPPHTSLAQKLISSYRSAYRRRVGRGREPACVSPPAQTTLRE